MYEFNGDLFCFDAAQVSGFMSYGFQVEYSTDSTGFKSFGKRRHQLRPAVSGRKKAQFRNDDDRIHACLSQSRRTDDLLWRTALLQGFYPIAFSNSSPTCRTCSSGNSGYTGSASTSRQARSDSGRSPGLYPKYWKQGCSCKGSG